MKTFAQQVLENIRRAGIVSPGDRVAVAVSGGADSVALFRVFMELRNRLGISLLLAHFDHALRGSESDADARFVETLARDYGVECINERGDVAALAARQRLNIEDAARRLRYAFFRRIVEQGRATRVAVAHTADDQAETLLARLFRGTGPGGLSGIHPVAGSIVRPLLAHRREEVREYLRGLGQAWQEDSSNSDLRRQRASIRAQLLPILERDFSTRIVRHLGELARLSREEQEFWDSLVEDRFSEFAREAGGRLTIRIDDLLSPLRSLSGRFSAPAPASRALTERLIRRLYEGVRGDRLELTARHVEQVIRLATESASGCRNELPHGVVVERNFGELIFSQECPAGPRRKTRETGADPPAYHYVVSLPTNGVTAISVPELGSRLLLKVIDWSSPERDTKLDDALDADLLPSTLTLRNWRPGDTYRPRGHRRTRKLKQLFLLRRVPRSERVHWPVIEGGGRIIWVRGMPPAAEFCARAGSLSGVIIQEDRL